MWGGAVTLSENHKFSTEVSIMAPRIKLSESLEDYLEAILEIIREKQAVRAKDIAGRLNVNRSSVTGALKALADKELINYAPYDVITLTPKGAKAAEDISRRHAVLLKFLVEVLLVPPAEADEAACKMEHAVSKEIFERLIRYLEFTERCPLSLALKSSGGFEAFCRQEPYPAKCDECLSSCVRSVRDFLERGNPMDPSALGKDA